MICRAHVREHADVVSVCRGQQRSKSTRKTHVITLVGVGLASAKAWNDCALGKTLKRNSVYLTKRRELHGRFNTIASGNPPPKR